MSWIIDGRLIIVQQLLMLLTVLNLLKTSFAVVLLRRRVLLLAPQILQRLVHGVLLIGGTPPRDILHERRQTVSILTSIVISEVTRVFFILTPSTYFSVLNPHSSCHSISSNFAFRFGSN